VFLDGGGTIVLPNRTLVAETLSSSGVEIDLEAVPRAHYRAVRALDRGHAMGVTASYVGAFCSALGISPARLAAATEALSELADRSRSGKVLWSEPTPGAPETVAALLRAGTVVVVVTNSDGHAQDNLRDSGFLSASGLSAGAVIDSKLVGSEKPDGRIFELALQYAGVPRSSAVHVGDMLSTDVAGARSAGIAPVHVDPFRICRSAEHRHVRTLRGVSSHLELPIARRSLYSS
jgi:FMN phosphatase YigB (HAD superfamily)